MALNWFKPVVEAEEKKVTGEGEKVADTSDFELKPQEVKEKLDKIDSLSTRMEEFNTKAAVLDRMASFMDSYEAAKKPNQTQTQSTTDEELETQFLSDPVGFMKRMQSPVIESQVNTNAKLAISELIEHSPEEFEYMSDPTIRKEVENYVLQLPIQSRTNTDSIRNCYFVAKGRHEAEIKEGKIKSRMSAVSSSGNSSGNPGVQQTQKPVLSEAEKQAAKIFGMSEEDYVKNSKELNYV